MFLNLSLGMLACRAEEVLPAGEMPLDLSLWTASESRSDTIMVHVSATSRSEHGSGGLVRVRLPRGIVLISGDTTFSVAARRVQPPAVLRLRATKPGTYEVVATLSVGEAARNSDLAEVRLPLVVYADSVHGATSEVMRAETTLNGQRYRYGGLWLVPLGEDEVVSYADFARGGTKPKPLGPLVAHCAACPADADTVNMVAVIDRSGKVIQSRPLGKPPHAEVMKAVAEALAKARFQPAKHDDRVITDWIHIRVPIVRTP